MRTLLPGAGSSAEHAAGCGAERLVVWFLERVRCEVNHSSKIATDLKAVWWHKKNEGSENTHALTGLVKHDSEVSLE